MLQHHQLDAQEFNYVARILGEKVRLCTTTTNSMSKNLIMLQEHVQNFTELILPFLLLPLHRNKT